MSVESHARYAGISIRHSGRNIRHARERWRNPVHGAAVRHYPEPAMLGRWIPASAGMTMSGSLRVFVTLLVLAALSPDHLSAQQRQPSPGDYIRLYGQTRNDLRAEGLVERVDSGRIIIALNGSGRAVSETINWNDLAAVRRSVPAPRRIQRGGLWGAFLGGSAGGIASPFILKGSDDGSIDAASIATGIAAGALVGGGIGALIGYIVPQHGWEFIRIQPGH
jgi:hypothetical protein